MLGLAGCTSDGGPSLVQVALRSPSITFESIDGPPAAVFQRLVGELAAEAQRRQVVVVSRESPAAFRVRGYLAANVVKGRTHFDWVWDVYDAESHRAMRVAGEELSGTRTTDAWAALDDVTLNRIARDSMDRLVSLIDLPGAPPEAPARAFVEESSALPLPTAGQVVQVVRPAGVRPH